MRAVCPARSVLVSHVTLALGDLGSGVIGWASFTEGTATSQSKLFSLLVSLMKAAHPIHTKCTHEHGGLLLGRAVRALRTREAWALSLEVLPLWRRPQPCLGFACGECRHSAAHGHTPPEKPPHKCDSHKPVNVQGGAGFLGLYALGCGSPGGRQGLPLALGSMVTRSPWASLRPCPSGPFL